MPSAIRVENLSKRYRLGLTHDRSIRDLVNRWTHGLTNRGQTTSETASPQEFWALRDVNFEVQPGEVVGIIGRNGAGKSTLLKVLSRITKPSTGRVELRGRVASLLEVGTGFHPELTGRENVYMNGTVLGMTRREIDCRFDDIVAFADVEKFIDTPVKRYSSGMTVRLGFAVAAHLEPEILIVDEVLAVGDAEFQRKCLDKMGEVARGGRTVLFVSHNMPAIQSLCSSAILIHSGTVKLQGDVGGAVHQYLQHSSVTAGATWRRETLVETKAIYFTDVNSCIEGMQPQMTLEIDARLASANRHRAAFVAVEILDEGMTPLMQAIPTSSGFLATDSTDHVVQLSVDLPPLIPGRYYCTLWVGPNLHETFDEVPCCVAFEIAFSPTPGRTIPHHPSHGRIVPTSRIHTNRPI